MYWPTTFKLDVRGSWTRREESSVMVVVSCCLFCWRSCLDYSDSCAKVLIAVDGWQSQYLPKIRGREKREWVIFIKGCTGGLGELSSATVEGLLLIVNIGVWAVCKSHVVYYSGEVGKLSLLIVNCRPNTVSFVVIVPAEGKGVCQLSAVI